METKIELIKEEIIKSIQIDQSAFRNSQFRGEFNCPNLQEVGNSAFLNSEFNGVFNCPNLQEVGQFAFSLSYFRGEFNCQNLQEVGKFAFRYSVFTGEFNCPNLQTVGNNAFANSKFTGEFNCPNLQEVGNEAFYFSKFNGAFNCPNLTLVGDYAFANSTFDTITIGANATLGTRCIGAHSEEFINDYEANGRQAGTYVWNGEHWIYQNKETKKIKNMETKEKNIERKEQIVVAFQVGTLSKYAPKKKGTLTYLGEYNFKDIQKLRANEIFYKEKDGKTIITDEMGNIVSDDDINGDVGVLNFDEEYDTTYCKYLEDCSDIEIEIINNDNLIFD